MYLLPDGREKVDSLQTLCSFLFVDGFDFDP